MVKNIFNQSFLLVLFCLTFNTAWAVVESEVTPQESNGNPVTMRFTLRNEDDFEIVKNPEGNGDWQVQGPQQVTNSQFTYSNGKAEQMSSVTLTFILFPLKTGQLKVPIAQIKIKDKVYTSPQTSVRVTQLSQNNNAPLRKKGPKFPIFPLDQQDQTDQPNQEALPPPINLSKENRKLEVAVVAEPSKVEVYSGELILLPFYIYTNENIFRNLEFAGFPTFKDFIKEELYLPKNWRTERVQYRGSAFYKAEIIRFALFPLKDGELLIDPLKMRFEVDNDIFSLFQQMMNGEDEDKQKNAQTFMRSSGSVPIKVKALPPKPAGVAQNEIAVGQYKINVQPPRADLVQNEPFSIKVRIEGKGNIKGIPEPEFSFPNSLQKSKTDTDYSINTVSEGYKDFDLLLVPRSSGQVIIPENNWSYFDPDKKTYETVKIPSIELKIFPSNKKNPLGDKAVAVQDTIISGEQDFEKESSPVIPLWAWSFPGLLYAFSVFLYVQRRNHEKEEALIGSMPWLLVERKINAQHDLSSNEALGLVEEWILCRFRVLNIQEAAFDDLTDALKRKVPSNVDSKIEKLRERFKQIEFARFSGKKKNSLNLSFTEIKKLSEEIIDASFAAMTAAQQKYDESDDDDE